MKILIALHHPAKVHLFKNFYWELINKGHDVLVLVVNKEISIQLLNIYDIPYHVVGTNRKSTLAKAFELLISEIKYLVNILNFSPDVVVGDESPAPAHTSFLTNTPYIAFADTEHAKLTWKIAKPFITKIITPECFLKDFGHNHIRYNGYKELAYLHPNYFKPDSKIYRFLEIQDNEPFVFMRFISWSAHHDKGHQGLSEKIKIKAVTEFEKHAKVFISSEGDLPEPLEKYRIDIPIHKIHHVLYFASLYFGESGTMATESAILGTPSVRVSSLAKLLGNFRELSETYDLIRYYDSDQQGYDEALKLLVDENSKQDWQRKADVLIEDKIDVTSFMVDFITDSNNY